MSFPSTVEKHFLEQSIEITAGYVGLGLTSMNCYGSLLSRSIFTTVVGSDSATSTSSRTDTDCI